MTPKLSIWIAPRTDGKAGTGTRLNPFNGTGAERFDKLMREQLKPDVRVHLVPWTGTQEQCIFLTSGSKSYNEANGYYIPRRCEIIGPGPDVVTVRKIAHPDTGGNAHGVFETDYTSDGNNLIEGLTIDEGGQFLAGKATSTFAARLHGDHNTLKKIHAVGGYGHRASGSEAFGLVLNPNFKNGSWQNNVSGMMESLTVSHFAGDYGIAITPGPGADGTGSVRTFVRDCLVADYKGTAPYGMPSNVMFQRCKAVGCLGGWYGDTGVEQINFEMDDCKILSPISGRYGVHFNPVGDKVVRGVVIQRCYFEVSNAGIVASGSAGPGHQFDFKIENNTFIRVGNEDALGISFSHVDGALVTGNLSDGLRYVLSDPQYPSKNIICRRNGRLPVPEGLEESAPKNE